MLPPNSAARTQPYAFLAVALLAFLVGVSFSPRSQAATVSTVYSFTDDGNGAKNGSTPNGGLALGPDGNLYGTTQTGGITDVGTVFKVSPTGILARIYSFTGGIDGDTPNDGLVLDSAGNIYGTTQNGGVKSSVCGGANLITACSGTVFKIDTNNNNNLTSLHTFSGGDDGAMPNGGLLLKDGYLYGTTQTGGSEFDSGIIFKISITDNTMTILHTFTDGDTPNGGLVLGSDGKLYGTTQGGGADGAGNLFVISTVSDPTTSHDTFMELYAFPNTDGGFPQGLIPNGGLVQDGNGTLYGTTQAGGQNDKGTAFKFVPSTGQFTSLYSFTGGDDGDTPNGGLALGADGDIYGTTQIGGSGYGTVFKIIPANVVTGKDGLVPVHAFTGNSDGDTPNGGLVLLKDGYLYGTTQFGGVDANNSDIIGLGAVFKLDTQAAPASSPPPSGGGGGGGSLGLLTLAFLSVVYMLRKSQLRPAVLRRHA